MIISEEVFILSILIFAVIGMLIYHFQEKFSVSSSTSLEGFKSKKRVLDYFRETKELIFKKKWLLSFPLVLYLLQYVFNSIFFIYSVIKTRGSEFLFSMGNTNLPSELKTIFQFEGVLAYINSLFSIPTNFSFIYYGKFINNVIFMFVALLFIIFFKVVITKIKEYTGEKNNKNIAFLKKILQYTLIFSTIILSFTLILILIRNNFDSISDFNNYFLGLGLVMNVAVVVLFSFFQGFILLNIKEFFSKESYSLSLKIKKSLNKFKPLLKFNLILFVILNIKLVMFYTPLLENLMGGYIIWLEYLLILINLLVVILTMFTPYFIVFEEKDIIEGLRDSLDFIKFNFLKYTILIILFTVIEFCLVSFISSINFSIHGYIYDHIASGIVGAIDVTFRVIFPIMLTKFYFDYSHYKTER